MPNKEKNRILITGGAGYIGSATTKAFLDNGFETTVFDNLSTGQRNAIDSRASFVEGDVRDTDALRGVFEKEEYNAVVHLAAFKSIDEGELKPELYLENNVDGTHHVLIEMARANVPNIIFSSSAAVYGKQGDVPCGEDIQLEPSNVYGRTKFLAEELIHSYVESGAIKKGTILRYFNVAGTGSDFKEVSPSGLFSHVAYAIKNGQPVKVYGNDYHTPDGTCIRDYVHVSDIAQAHIDGYSSGGGVFNIGSGTGYSVEEVLGVFEEYTKKNISVIYEQRRAGDIAFSRADTRKVHEKLGWKPKRLLRDMVASTLQMYDV